MKDKAANIIIRRATTADSKSIAHIGRVAVELSHRDSCSVEAMNEFLDAHYTEEAIAIELNDPDNIYYIVLCDGNPAGFSKIVLNAEHPNIANNNTTKLDRIYLLSNYYDQNLGYQLLQRNIQKQNNAYQTITGTPGGSYFGHMPVS